MKILKKLVVQTLENECDGCPIKIAVINRSVQVFVFKEYINLAYQPGIIAAVIH